MSCKWCVSLFGSLEKAYWDLYLYFHRDIYLHVDVNPQHTRYAADDYSTRVSLQSLTLAIDMVWKINGEIPSRTHTRRATQERREKQTELIGKLVGTSTDVSNLKLTRPSDLEGRRSDHALVQKHQPKFP